MKPQEYGPVYGVLLLNDLPLNGGMRQKLPSRADLEDVRRYQGDRVAAGFEVLTVHYRNAMQRVTELEAEVVRLQSELSNKSIDADENAYHMREDSDQASRSGLHFTHGCDDR